MLKSFKVGDRVMLMHDWLGYSLPGFERHQGILGTIRVLDSEPECETHAIVKWDNYRIFSTLPISYLATRVDGIVVEIINQTLDDVTDVFDPMNVDSGNWMDPIYVRDIAVDDFIAGRDLLAEIGVTLMLDEKSH